MTRIISFAALGIIRSNAKLLLVTSFSSVLLTVAGVIFFRSVLGAASFPLARLYDLGVPQLAFQAVFMSLFAVRFLRLYLSQHHSAPPARTYLKTVAGYLMRVLGLGFVISLVWLALLSAGIAVLDNFRLTDAQLNYLPIAIFFLSSTFFGWLWFRLALALPAYVVGQPISWRVAWRASRSFKYQAIFMSIIYYVLPWFALVVIALFSGVSIVVEPLLTMIVIWVFAILKVTTFAVMYDRMLADQQSAMSEAFD